MRRNGIIICLCLLLAGCAPSPAPADSPPTPAVAFTDALGREVTVQKADRVAAMLGSFADIWLLAGGVLYSVGGVLYAVKWPGRDNPRFGCHEIFHVFILLGSVFHYLMMLQVILPLF